MRIQNFIWLRGCSRVFCYLQPNALPTVAETECLNDIFQGHITYKGHFKSITLYMLQNCPIYPMVNNILSKLTNSLYIERRTWRIQCFYLTSQDTSRGNKHQTSMNSNVNRKNQTKYVSRSNPVCDLWSRWCWSNGLNDKEICQTEKEKGLF